MPATGTAPAAIDTEMQVMAGIAATVAGLSLFAPRILARLLLMDPDTLNGSARFALRLFATRNVWVVWRSLGGDASVQSAYLPIQAMDQVVFAHAGLRGDIPRRTWALAAATSGAIVAAGLRRRG